MSRVLLMGLALMVAAPGCRVQPLHDQAWVLPRPLAAGVASYRPPTEPPRDHESWPAVPPPAGVITLRQAVAAALVHSPRLQSFSWAVRMREAQTLQAGLWPNPEVEVEVENFGGTGATRRFDAAETTVLLSQVIPLAHRIDKRARVFELDADLAGWDYEAARVATATDVVRSLVDVDAAQRRIELARKNLDLAKQVFDVADKKVEAGAVSPLERTRAGVVLETSRIELRRMQRAMVSARHRLAATWGSTAPSFERVSADLETLLQIPSYDQLVARVDQNPQLARWAAEVAQRRAAIEWAKAQAVPDVMAGGGIKRLEESDDTAAVVQFSVPLPLFDRNQGGILEARYALAKGRADQRAAHVEVRTRLAEAYQELDAALIEATSLRDTVLPAAQEAFDATSKAYQAGQRSYLEVLDAQRSLFEARGHYIDALATFHKAAAEVEGLTGQALHRNDSNHLQDEPIDGDKR